jgi:hypothetical protein
MFNRETGLLSAAFLAASAFHVTYSRSGYAQAKAVFFVALGLFAWYVWRNKAERWRNLVAGALIGYAFTCHFNLFAIPILVVVLELDGSRALNLRQRFVRLFDLGAGMAAPLLMFELPVRILRWVGALPDGHQTYYEQYFYRGTLAGSVHFSASGLHAILNKIWISEGLLTASALSIGLIILLKGLRKFEHRALMLTLVIPALPWCFLSSGLPPLYRTFIVLALPGSLIAGLGLSHLLARLRTAWLPYAVCAGVLAVGTVHTAPLLPLTSGYRKATARWLDYVSRERGTIAFFPGSSWPIYYFYLSSAYNHLDPVGRDRIVFYPGRKDAIPPRGDFDAFDIKRQVRSYWSNRPELREHYRDLAQVLEPVIRVANPAAHLPPAFEEAAGDRYLASLSAARATENAPYIEVFDLRQLPKLTSLAGKYFPASVDHAQ